jgi:hypothetical protein
MTIPIKPPLFSKWLRNVCGEAETRKNPRRLGHSRQHAEVREGDMTMRADITGPAVALWKRWTALRTQADNLPPTDAGAEEQDRLCEQWCDASLLLSRTPATSLAGVAAKLRVLAAEIDVGKATDDRDLALAETALQDLERLLGASDAEPHE